MHSRILIRGPSVGPAWVKYLRNGISGLCLNKSAYRSKKLRHKENYAWQVHEQIARIYLMNSVRLVVFLKENYPYRWTILDPLAAIVGFPQLPLFCSTGGIRVRSNYWNQCLILKGETLDFAFSCSSSSLPSAFRRKWDETLKRCIDVSRWTVDGRDAYDGTKWFIRVSWEKNWLSSWCFETFYQWL